MKQSEIIVRTAGFRETDVVVTPDDYGLSEENLQRALQMIRAHEIIKGTRRSPQIFNILSKDFGRPVGTTKCVTVHPVDHVVWIRLKGRNVWGKFVWDRQPETTSHLTLILKLVRGQWRLIRAFPGEHAPAFPGDRNEAPASRTFWANHAMVRGSIPVDRDCRPRRDCPW